MVYKTHVQSICKILRHRYNFIRPLRYTSGFRHYYYSLTRHDSGSRIVWIIARETTASVVLGVFVGT